MRHHIVALILAMSFPATGWCDYEPVPAGKMFSGDLLNIRSPDSEGWSLVQSSPEGWAFARTGTGSNDSYVANVTAFPLAATGSSQEFMDLIRRGIDEDTSPDRFKILAAALEYTEARGYPCVSYQATAEDRKAKVSLFSRQLQKLQIHSLYCRHPRRQDLGFSIVFSHRGPELDPDLADQGRAFVEGVQVPPDAATSSSEANEQQEK